MRKNVIYIQENNNLNRFIIAQEKTYDIALKEIKEGKKSSHWKSWKKFLMQIVSTNLLPFLT